MPHNATPKLSKSLVGSAEKLKSEEKSVVSEQTLVRSSSNRGRRAGQSRQRPRLAYQLRDTYRVFLSLLQRDLRRYRIPTSGWFFLRVLWQEDGLSQKDLAARAGLLQSNSSAALKQMQRYGLISQVVDRSDRRRVTIYLTPRARKLEKILVPIAAALRDIAMRDFSLMKRPLCSICYSVSSGTLRDTPPRAKHFVGRGVDQGSAKN